MTDIKPNPIITDLPSPAPSDPLEALSWLGDTVEEIAEGLRARGIKGWQKVAHSCPLANYLRTWWDDPSIYTYVSVSDTETGYYYSEIAPAPCRQFIYEFDSGNLPDLVS